MNEEIKLEGDDEDSDIEMPAKSSEEVVERSLEDVETADEKRLRLARAYLGTLAREAGGEEEGGGGEEEEEEDEDEARGVLRMRPTPTPSSLRDAISSRLRQDALLISGQFFRPASVALQALGLAPDCITFVKAHKLPVTCVAISYDGTTVVSGSKDCTLLRWTLGGSGGGGSGSGSGSSGSSGSGSNGGGVLSKSGLCPGRPRSRADVARQLELSNGGKEGAGVLVVRGGTFGGGRLGPIGGDPAGGAAKGVFQPKITRNVGGVSTIIAEVSGKAGGVSGALGLRKVPDYGIGGHWGEVLCVAVSSDGSLIASGGRDKTVRIWDGKVPEDNEEDKAVAAAAAAATAAAASSSSSSSSSSASASSASAPPRSKLPQIANLENFVGHKDAVSSLSFRPGSHILYSGGLDRLVKLWSLDEMAYTDTLFGHQGEVLGMDAPRGGGAGGVAVGKSRERCISVGGDRTARLWKIGEGSQLVFRGASTAQSLETVCCITDTVFLTGSTSGSLSLWSTQKKRPLYTLHLAHGTGVHCPEGGRHAPPGALLKAASAVEQFEVGGEEGGLGGVRGQLAHPGAFPTLARTTAVEEGSGSGSGSGSGGGGGGGGGGGVEAQLASISRVTGAGVDGLSGGYCSSVTALALMPGSDVVASGGGDGFIRFWRLISGGSGSGGGGPGDASMGASFRALEHIAHVPCKGIINGLSFSQDGRTLVAAVGTEHRLGRWWRYTEAKNGLAVISLPPL